MRALFCGGHGGAGTATTTLKFRLTTIDGKGRIFYLHFLG